MADTQSVILPLLTHTVKTGQNSDWTFFIDETNKCIPRYNFQASNNVRQDIHEQNHSCGSNIEAFPPAFPFFCLFLCCIVGISWRYWRGAALGSITLLIKAVRFLQPGCYDGLPHSGPQQDPPAALHCPPGRTARSHLSSSALQASAGPEWVPLNRAVVKTGSSHPLRL